MTDLEDQGVLFCNCGNGGNNFLSIKNEQLDSDVEGQTESSLEITPSIKQETLDYEIPFTVDFELKLEPKDPLFMKYDDKSKLSSSPLYSHREFDDIDQSVVIPNIKKEEDSLESACNQPWPTLKTGTSTHSTTLFPCIEQAGLIKEKCNPTPCLVLLKRFDSLLSSDLKNDSKHLPIDDSPKNYCTELNTFSCDEKLTVRSCSPHSVDFDGMNFYKCEFCKKSYRLKKSLHHHKRSKHLSQFQDKLRYTCNYCERTYSTKTSMKRHIDTLHLAKGNFEYTCDYCKKMYASKTAVKNHINSSHLPLNLVSNRRGSWICKICHYAFTDPSNLNRHLRKAHSKLPKFYRKPLSTAKPQCEVCGSFFATNSSKKLHFKRFHMDNRMPKNVGRSRLSNLKTSKQRYRLNQELLALNIPLHECKICGALFKDKGHLNRHKERHSGIKYDCHLCGQKYSDKDGLNRHMRRVHIKTG